jgi:hypothetical protein
MRQRPHRAVPVQMEQIYAAGGSSPRERPADMYGEMLLRADSGTASTVHPPSPHFRGKSMV